MAVAYFESQFRERFKQNRTNERQLEEHIAHLLTYFDAFEGLGHRLIELDHKINIDVGNHVHIGGLVSRVDLVLQGGYAVYIFERENSSWQRELRMPLIQGEFAREFACSISQISVGIYSLARGRHESTRYTISSIKTAYSEVRRLAAILSKSG